MTNQKFFNYWKTLEDKGIGNILGILKTNLEDETIYYYIHEKRVKMIRSKLNQDIYGTIISSDIYSLKNKKLVENKEQIGLIIYCGKERSKAITSFERIVNTDRKMREDKLYEIFSRN